MEASIVHAVVAYLQPQSLRDFEDVLVVVDTPSTDDTYAVEGP